MFIHECAVCRSHATMEYHSTYYGNPIEFATSWITGSRHYHSNAMSADTLGKIKEKIRVSEGGQWDRDL